MGKAIQASLQLRDAYDDEVFLDRVRIPEQHRGGLKDGAVYAITRKDTRVTWYAEVRGANHHRLGDRRPPLAGAYICMDEKLRARLGFSDSDRRQHFDFLLRYATKEEELKWQREHSDPRVRIAARLADSANTLALISFLFGTVLAVVQISMAIDWRAIIAP